MPRKPARKGTKGEWMRPAEAAKLLGVTRPTVLARALKGEFATTEVAGLVFVARADVEIAVSLSKRESDVATSAA